MNAIVLTVSSTQETSLFLPWWISSFPGLHLPCICECKLTKIELLSCSYRGTCVAVAVNINILDRSCLTLMLSGMTSIRMSFYKDVFCSPFWTWKHPHTERIPRCSSVISLFIFYALPRDLDKIGSSFKTTNAQSCDIDLHWWDDW